MNNLSSETELDGTDFYTPQGTVFLPTRPIKSNARIPSIRDPTYSDKTNYHPNQGSNSKRKPHSKRVRIKSFHSIRETTKFPAFPILNVLIKEAINGTDEKLATRADIVKYIILNYQSSIEAQDNYQVGCKKWQGQLDQALTKHSCFKHINFQVDGIVQRKKAWVLVHGEETEREEVEDLDGLPIDDDGDVNYDGEPIDENYIPEKKPKKERKSSIDDAYVPNKESIQGVKKTKKLSTDKKRRKEKESKLSNFDSKTSRDLTVSIEEPQELNSSIHDVFAEISDDMNKNETNWTWE